MNGFKISAIIMDLDGTLIDTERATRGVLKEFLVKYGKVPDPQKEEKRLGMMHKEAAAIIVRDYELPMSAEEYSAAIMPMYQEKWSSAKVLPGVNRLIKHLLENGIPFALASNSLRKHILLKISHQQGWKESFSVILGSDDVCRGKPSPDIFLEAAKRLGVDASNCLVIEDSLVGVRAAKAAGAHVLAVPSIQTELECFSAADCVLHSLLEFRPESWGLPPFEDWIEQALPFEPLLVTGLISKGIQNDGCTMLNIITETESYASMPDQMSGIFIGWAKHKIDGMLKLVLSTGWDITLGAAIRATKTLVLGHISVYARKEPLILLLVGYVRELHNKEVEITEEDIRIAARALEHPTFSRSTCSPLFD